MSGSSWTLRKKNQKERMLKLSNQGSATHETICSNLGKGETIQSLASKSSRPMPDIILTLENTDIPSYALPKPKRGNRLILPTSARLSVTPATLRIEMIVVDSESWAISITRLLRLKMTIRRLFLWKFTKVRFNALS